MSKRDRYRDLCRMDVEALRQQIGHAETLPPREQSVRLMELSDYAKTLAADLKLWARAVRDAAASGS